MAARTPHEIPALFARALNAGDVDAVAALYEPEAVLFAEPEKPVHGRSAIRDGQRGFLAQRPRFTLHEARVAEAGNLALVCSSWTIAMSDTSGTPTELRVRATLVTRRQADGTWLVVIDQPVAGP